MITTFSMCFYSYNLTEEEVKNKQNAFDIKSDRIQLFRTFVKKKK